ncbi:MAG: DUF1385 domain-containing protein [Oscillospiraceae bacterium]|nr:DUF1385 domain-containing protein [Oscillospiraceae bacterium]
MAKKETQCCNEKFKTSIGGQALIEGIMMRGPEKDAVVVRGKEGLTLEVTPRKIRKKGSFATWPLIRGAVNFFDSQVVGVKALMRSADLAPEEYVEEEQPSKLDQWLEKRLGNEKFQQFIIGFAVFLGLAMSIGLFFLLPMVISSFFDGIIKSNLLLTLLEGLVRMVIFMAYMYLVSRMKEMKRVFAYHGAEHKTIRCYEAGLPLTVENVRAQTRLHPRCGTSFLLVVMVISILVFSIASSLLLSVVPALAEMRGSFLYRLIMIVFKLLLLPLIVAITYEINRWAGRHDNAFTRILTFPGMWLQNFTTNEPDDSMIEVGIAAVQAVLPEEEGADRW